MLADHATAITQTGTFAGDLHLPDTARLKLIDFIAGELPRWRDHPDRPQATASETQLSEHLCDYLTGAARRSEGYDCFQFRTETTDEENKGRKIDLSIKPCGVAVWIEGRRHTQFEAIMPVECKRLPTPPGRDRDEQEYVVVRDGSTGGIQRFKFGHHGSRHAIAAMIAYIQEHDGVYWNNQIAAWISALVRQPNSEWSKSDLLSVVEFDSANRLSRLCSTHQRTGGRKPIHIHHLWAGMN